MNRQPIGRRIRDIASPRFPDVDSTTTVPQVNGDSRCIARTSPKAVRSFVEPVGLKDSSFTSTENSRLPLLTNSFTIGVCPMAVAINSSSELDGAVHPT